MLRRLLVAAVALALLVACSPDNSANYKRPTPKSSAPTTTIPFQQQVDAVTDCRVLLAMEADEMVKIPPGAPDNAAVAQAKRNLVAIYLRQVALNCSFGRSAPPPP